MKISKTTTLTAAQKDTIRYLWNREYPKQLAVTPETFDVYLAGTSAPYHLLVTDDAGEIAAWAYTFDRDGGRWLTIIINSLYQRIGLGRTLLQLLKEREDEMNGWVIDHDRYTKQNGEPYESPLTFYQQNGFDVIPESRWEDEKLSAVRVVWKKSG